MKSLKPTLMTVVIALAMFASVAIAGASTSVESTQTKRLVIGPNLVDCTGIAPQKCIQILNQTTGKYENFYGEIQGFHFESGSKALIEVQETTHDPKTLPADMSNIEYSLIRVIKSRSQSSLIQGSWKITALNGESVTSPAYVNFLQGGKLSARVCNIFSGNYSLLGNTLHATNLISTKMACMGELGILEASFDLDGAKILQGKDGLSLTTKKGDIFILKNQDIFLKNTSWKLESIDGKAVTNNLKLNFGSHNTLGATICNVMSGNYELINGHISAPNLISTLMYCEGEKGEIEQTFKIDNASYTIDGDTLTLTTTEDKIFVWKK